MRRRNSAKRCANSLIGNDSGIKYLENVEQYPGELPDHQARNQYFVRGDFVAVDKKASNYRLAFVREQMDAMRDVLRLNIGAILYTRTPLQKLKENA